MKKIQLFYLEKCPFCKKTLAWIKEVKKEDKKLENIDIEMIEETKEKELADKMDYYRVPTFYVDGVKVHEGAASKEIVKKVLYSAL